MVYADLYDDVKAGKVPDPRMKPPLPPKGIGKKPKEPPLPPKSKKGGLLDSLGIWMLKALLQSTCKTSYWKMAKRAITCSNWTLCGRCNEERKRQLQCKLFGVITKEKTNIWQYRRFFCRNLQSRRNTFMCSHVCSEFFVSQMVSHSIYQSRFLRSNSPAMFPKLKQQMPSQHWTCIINWRF